MDFKMNSSLDTCTKVLENYQVNGILGKGGFATVYSGFDKKTHRPVAIKVIPEEKIHRYTCLSGIMVPSEVEVLTRLHHKDIIGQIDHFSTDENYVVVFERPEESVDLFDYVNHHGPLPEEESRHIMKHIFSAVKYCHNNGIVHWDIKDENILIDLRNRCAKLIDFGHAGVFNPDKTYTRYEGTRAYSPPEWLKKGEYHAESATVWTLGVVLYIMLQGDVPFGNDQEVLQGKLRFNRDLSNDARDLLSLMLHQNPTERPTLEKLFLHPWIVKGDAAAQCCEQRRVDKLTGQTMSLSL